jgi:nucleotide-binding universal stress UspA family protein
MRIIVAYDGSEGARRALEEVKGRPWPEGTEVRLVAVAEPSLPYLPMEGVAEYGPVLEGLHASVRERMRRSLIEAARSLKERSDLEVTWELREPGVKRALLDAIKEWNADLVVVGSQGTTALGRLFLGSVCHALVTHAPCNVEIVRAPAAA